MHQKLWSNFRNAQFHTLLEKIDGKTERSTLGVIADMVLYLKVCKNGFEVFGTDKVGRKVVLVRRKELVSCVEDAAEVAQDLANFRKKNGAVRYTVRTGGGILPRKSGSRSPNSGHGLNGSATRITSGKSRDLGYMNGCEVRHVFITTEN